MRATSDRLGGGLLSKDDADGDIDDTASTSSFTKQKGARVEASAVGIKKKLVTLEAESARICFS